jgi:hypothetical protein
LDTVQLLHHYNVLIAVLPPTYYIAFNTASLILRVTHWIRFCTASRFEYGVAHSVRRALDTVQLFNHYNILIAVSPPTYSLALNTASL